MTSAPILNKKQNYQLWQSGAFGNKLKAWRTVEEWRASGFQGEVVLRTLLLQGGGPCHYGVDPADVDDIVELWVSAGIPRELIMLNESAPNDKPILQGEYLNDICEIDGNVVNGVFFCSRYPAPMRIALAQVNYRETVFGLRADIMIRGAMTTGSYEDWRELLDRYPSHVLEVSIYDRCIGDIPRRNALVWEVRRY